MEAQLLLGIHQHASALLDNVFLASHVVGGPYFSTAFALTMAVWHFRRRERGLGVTWLVLGLSTVAIMEVLKVAVGRSRPALWPRMIEETGFSFPSGHALASATFYPVLAWEASRRNVSWKRIFHALAVLGVLWVGVGRLYLGVHWPSDVCMGWALGALQGATAIHRLNAAKPADPP